MIQRYPDKPIASSPLVLPVLPAGEYLAEFKYDGWRTYCERDAAGRWTYTTRWDKPCPVTADCRAAFEARLDAALPPGPALLDSEWMSRRHGLTEERFWLFDALRLGGADLWDHAADERFALLRATVPADLVVPWTDRDYAAFFEQSKANPATEGIVLKLKASRYLGSVRACEKNPAWLKVKWRDGSDGQRRVA